MVLLCTAACAVTYRAVSPPLEDPAPHYVLGADAVLSWHDASYSTHAWPLPRLQLRCEDAARAAGAFAAALLAGAVFPSLAGISSFLLAPAASAARPELAGLPRVGELLAALQHKQVGDCCCCCCCRCRLLLLLLVVLLLCCCSALCMPIIACVHA